MLPATRRRTVHHGASSDGANLIGATSADGGIVVGTVTEPPIRDAASLHAARAVAREMAVRVATELDHYAAVSGGGTMLDRERTNSTTPSFFHTHTHIVRGCAKICLPFSPPRSQAAHQPLQREKHKTRRPQQEARTRLGHARSVTSWRAAVCSGHPWAAQARHYQVMMGAATAPPMPLLTSTTRSWQWRWPTSCTALASTYHASKSRLPPPPPLPSLPRSESPTDAPPLQRLRKTACTHHDAL